MSHYVDLLLPLPLAQTFTYRLPDHLASDAVIGGRVIVPFGKAHQYTGIITALHDNAPEGCEVKEIIEVLDHSPIVLPSQLELWSWMADYYICSRGEVMKAALPSGLKPESETVVRINPEYEEDTGHRLAESEQMVLDLMGEKAISIGALEKLSGKKNLLPVVRRLLEKEALFIDETIVRRYKPKTRHYVRLLLPTGKVEDLAPIFDSLKRSTKQQALLMKMLDMSRILQQSTPNVVSQQDLLRASGCSQAVLRQLIQKGIVEIYTDTVSRMETESIALSIEPLATLSEAQQSALLQIKESFKKFDVTLLHGVTSSGKTEIYTHLISETLAKGQNILYMVPEIALTTQLCQRLRRRFGNQMAVYHSKLSDGERIDLWRMLMDTPDKPMLILGVRSSIFLPFHNLGLIIVDEEHEPSYKQQDPAPRYHGRDVALVMAHRHQGKVLLGSATPAVESYYLAQEGRYGLVTLTQRHGNLHLPNISLISMTEARKAFEMQGPFTPQLVSRLGATLHEGKQAILFQNRRGFAPIVECNACSWTPRCPRCDVSLTYHKRQRQLVCHYCGHTMMLPTHCPSCHGQTLDTQGYGTERIEENINQILPHARTARMDTDTTQSGKSYTRIIQSFEQQKYNLLIGTQMISKGLDFDNVKMVGILNADTLMNMPDFRAHERAFQLMEQVAGRAGRKDASSEVIIQCSTPQHPLLQQVVRHDYRGMVEKQLCDRRRFHYPPFTRLIAIYLKGRYEDRTQQMAAHYAAMLTQSFGAERVLGPEAPIISRIKNFYIRKILLKVERSASPKEVRHILHAIRKHMAQLPDFKQMICYYDVDPMD